MEAQWNYKLVIKETGEFSGGLEVRILGFHCHGLGSIPGWGSEVPQTTRHSQKKKEKRERETGKKKRERETGKQF